MGIERRRMLTTALGTTAAALVPLPDPAFPGQGRPVRCASGSVEWVDGVNVVAKVRLAG
ncbi:MAG: hypothetical protein WCD21_37105 [Streptomyces sp.]